MAKNLSPILYGLLASFDSWYGWQLYRHVYDMMKHTIGTDFKSRLNLTLEIKSLKVMSVELWEITFPFNFLQMY